MNKNDFTGTMKWNRANPWWNSSMGLAAREFHYPLTCCPLNKIRDNWKNLPMDQLQQAASCALYGTNIYETVKFLSLRRLFINGFL